MYVYKIKVTFNNKLIKEENNKYKMFNLKLFKKNHLINKQQINSDTNFHPRIQNLKEVPNKNKENYTSFILNRYNAHLLMEHLHRDENRSSNDIKGSKKKLEHKYSFAISHRPQKQVKGYEDCSKMSAYIILKTEKKLNKKKLDGVNSKYRELTNVRKFNSSHEEPKLIKELWTGIKRFDNGRLVFKRSSPVIIKSTIKQIEREDCRNEFYSEIYKRNDVYEKAKRLYSFNVEKDRLSKSVYFIPKGTLDFKDNGSSPVIEVEEDDYIKMAMQTLGLEKTTEKLTNPRLSIIKVNKPNNGIENIFNVFGVAFELEEFSQQVFERANVHGLGHYTGFGFGFAYTHDLSSRCVAQVMKDNQKKKDSGNHHQKQPTKQKSNNNKYTSRKPEVKIEDDNYSNGLFNG